MAKLIDVSKCIGCKACEVACKQWNQLPSDGYDFSGNSYDNTMELSGTTWRHVAFIEQAAPIDAPPSMSLITVNIMLAATEIVIPVALNYFSLDGCAEILDTVKGLR